LAAAAPDDAASVTVCGVPTDRSRDAGVAVTPDGSPLTETEMVLLNEFVAEAETLT
jgi:hypothetical protein